MPVLTGGQGRVLAFKRISQTVAVEEAFSGRLASLVRPGTQGLRGQRSVISATTTTAKTATVLTAIRLFGAGRRRTSKGGSVIISEATQMDRAASRQAGSRVWRARLRHYFTSAAKLLGGCHRTIAGLSGLLEVAISTATLVLCRRRPATYSVSICRKVAVVSFRSG